MKRLIMKRRLQRQQRHGFTLVEMLVVIGIIVTLAGLVLPAYQAALAHARNTQCVSQLKELGNALFLYESDKKYYPPYARNIALRSGTGTTTVGWIPSLFPYLDKEDEYAQIIAGNTTRWQKEYSFIICPSENPDIGADLDGGGQLLFPMSYAINVGRQDVSSNSPPRDSRRAAISHNHTIDKADRQNTRISDITDGKANTILVSENMDLANFTNVGELMQGIAFDDDPTHGLSGVTSALIQPAAAPTSNLLIGNARPSSYHQNGFGFNVLYADLHVAPFVIDEESAVDSYYIYASQMTPGCNDDGIDWDTTTNCR